MMSKLLTLTLVFGLGACSKRHETAPFRLPQRVAPPFGLEDVPGGTPKSDALRRLSSLQSYGSGEFLTVNGLGEGTVAKVFLDRNDRTGEIEVHLSTCGDLRGRLAEAWGQGEETEAGKRWSNSNAHWTAELFVDSSGCDLLFTPASYFTTGPVAFGVSGQLRTGLSRDEAARIAPELLASDKYLPVRGFRQVEEGALINLTTGRILGEHYHVPARVAAALRLAWGAGARNVTIEREAEDWINPTARTRATLYKVENGDQFDLRLKQFVPFSEWLRTGVPAEIWDRPLKAVLDADPDRCRTRQCLYSTLLQPNGRAATTHSPS